MPVARVGIGHDQHDTEAKSVLHRFSDSLKPFVQRPAIGRIAPHPRTVVSPPSLKRIHFWGDVPFTSRHLCVGRAHVQVEREVLVDWVEDLRWGYPVVVTECSCGGNS